MNILFEIKKLNLIITQTKEIWQLPYKNKTRCYPVRKINIFIHQGHEYIKIKTKLYRKDSLYGLVTKCNYEYALPTDEVIPF